MNFLNFIHFDYLCVWCWVVSLLCHRSNVARYCTAISLSRPRWPMALWLFWDFWGAPDEALMDAALQAAACDWQQVLALLDKKRRQMSATAAVLFCFGICFFVFPSKQRWPKYRWGPGQINTAVSLAAQAAAEAHQWQVAMQIGSLDVELLSKCFEVMVPLQHLRYGLYVFTSLEFM